MRWFEDMGWNQPRWTYLSECRSVWLFEVQRSLNQPAFEFLIIPRENYLSGYIGLRGNSAESRISGNVTTAKSSRVNTTQSGFVLGHRIHSVVKLTTGLFQKHLAHHEQYLLPLFASTGPFHCRRGYTSFMPPPSQKMKPKGGKFGSLDGWIVGLVP
ncbi:hypothetical protein TNCV_2021601 [Trichonephila clavipes]|nr:hypothetical protein TNCV_2021601 [Trichonephila clavipes]